jgi:hypothetical protein
MGNPVLVACAKDSWTKVATNVQTGFIQQVSGAPNGYLQTYRDTGDAAPTLETQGVVAFEKDITEPISATAGIDVYIWAHRAAGSVRVDTP